MLIKWYVVGLYEPKFNKSKMHFWMEEQIVLYCKSSDEPTIQMWQIQEIIQWLCFKYSTAILQQCILAIIKCVLLHTNWTPQYCETFSETELWFLCKCLCFRGQIPYEIGTVITSVKLPQKVHMILGWRWYLHISIQIFRTCQSTFIYIESFIKFTEMHKFWDMASFYSTNKLHWLYVLTADYTRLKNKSIHDSIPGIRLGEKKH
jgi:hypothetical protein